MKSEPGTYAINDHERDGSTCWEGVRNYQARNLMRTMAVGDLALFYHSNAKPPGVAGVARVVREAYPDPWQWERDSKYYDPRSSRESPRWVMVDIEFVETFPRFVSLDEIRATPGLSEMVLVKRSRLSVQPVTREAFRTIVKMGGGRVRG